MMMAPSAWCEKVKFLGEDVEIMPLKNVKPGMVGYGESVFDGSQEIKRFEVEIKSINFYIKNKYIIWAKVWGGPNNIIDRAGVIAGMSGSPIYLQDPKDGQYKLIGALAYGYTLQPPSEALAGITPIKEMLGLQDLLAAYYGKKSKDSTQEPFQFLPNPDKIKVPLLLTGSEKAIKIFKTEMKKRLPFKFFERRNPGSNAASQVKTETGDNQLDITPRTLKPGEPISAVLSTGDLALAATGTVTLANSKGFLAFGHPFLWTGISNIPVFRAEIGLIVPNMLSSFKDNKRIVNPQLGIIAVDSSEGILGLWCPQNTMLPLSVSFSKQYINGFKKEYQWNIEIAQENPYSNFLLATGILYPIEFGSPNLAYLNFDIKADFIYKDNGDEQRLSISKSFFSKQGENIYSNAISLGSVYTMLGKAKKNLKEINVDIQVTQEKAEIPTLYLFDVELEKKLVKPSKEILLSLMLSDKKKYYSLTIKEIKAPDFQGEVKIRIQDSNSRLEYLINEALNEPSKIKKVLDFAKASANKKGVFYVEIQHIKLIAEREGIDNKGWKETIKKVDELVNTEIREIELPEIAGKFTPYISSQQTIRVKSDDIKDDIRKAAKEIVEETRNDNTIKFKPGLFINPPIGLFSDPHGKLRMNLLGLDVGLLKYKRLQIFNFGFGIANGPGSTKLYVKFAPVKAHVWKGLFAEVSVGINDNGKVLFGLGFSLKIK